MRNRIRAAALIMMAAFYSGVDAAQIWCAGKVSNIYVDNANYLTVLGAWRGDYTVLCNIRTTWKGIDPMTCLSWMGIAMTATSKQQGVTVYYADPAAVACNTLATYANSSPPIYVMLRYP